jgi:molybdopterin-guanine dinucleotide biosynthesis protein A
MLLPVHGFVLAGGKSSRMGRDKALLELGGQPLIQIAVAKLRTFCADVSIAGNRDDLAGYGPVVKEERADAGPAAGVEAGLKASTQPWVLFVPVDAPLVPEALLRLWVEEALRVNMTVSFLAAWEKQPAFCLLRKDRLAFYTAALEAGDRSLEILLHLAAESDGYSSWMYDPYDLYGYPEYRGPDDSTLERWFLNVNTPENYRRLCALAACADQAVCADEVDRRD